MKTVFLHLLWIFYLSISLTSCIDRKEENPIITAAREVIQRQIGDRALDIQFKLLDSQGGHDVYSIRATDGKLTLSGSSSVALCYAYRIYLREACHLQKTWSGANLSLPAVWPTYEKQQTVSPYLHRYFLNVCTFGYTSPYWDWKRWEEEIDWMALHGINMPLATIANEAIAERVWLKMGLQKEDIRQFFTAPAHLPWHRMGNLNTWDGPLTDKWMQRQITLQHQVLDRMKQLGMTPIVPAFAGFVPKAFVEIHPEVDCKHLSWGGFDPELNAFVLPPNSPYFQEIGKMFVQEWEKEFGEHTYYLSDSFNEMELPIDPNDITAKHQLLAQYGESIYRSIAAGNKNAVWVTQGWTFGYQHDFWDVESLKALLSKVPDEKMIIIDLGNDYPKWVWNTEQTWKLHNGFYGKQWIFSYVPNFGGKTLPTGDLQMYASSSAMALHATNKGNLVGFGSAPEGLENNEVIYELLADMGWSQDSINLDTWIASYGKSRYGAYPKSMQKEWEKFNSTVYSALYSYPRFLWQTVIPDKRRKSKHNMNDEFLQGIEYFLQSADDLRHSELYVNDALELAAYYLSVKADKIYHKALSDKKANRMTAAHAELNTVINILLQVDKLLASHPLYRLSPWVNAARACGQSESEKNYYEMNAKRLITTWGGFQEDYAARFWSGLIKDYYIPRLKIYFTSPETLDQWEESWLHTPWKNTTQPYEHPLDAAISAVQSFHNK